MQLEMSLMEAIIKVEAKGALHCVGAGACGSVWSSATKDDEKSSIALKREDGSQGRSLYNDFSMHRRVTEALRKPDYRTQDFLVPECHGYLGSSELPQGILKLFPPPSEQSCNMLISERVPTLSENTCNFLINEFCPPPLKDKIASDEKSRDCIIRPYLGRRRHGRSMFKSFALRNYILTIDQLEDFGIHSEQYAEAIAKALAFLHWAVRIDANYVEFVLASARDNTASAMFDSPHLGQHTLWVIDFDRCKEMPMNEEGIVLATAAFYRNDLYFPLPGRQNLADQLLWVLFKQSFLDASAELIGGEEDLAGLPEILIARIEKSKS